MIRALRPTDILPYVAFCHQISHATGESPPVAFRPVAVLGGFLERSFALEPGRESWVQIEHGQISGLISAKRRVGADVWDVDQLVYLPSADAPRTCMRLLKHLLAAASDDGVQKVFLRVGAANPALGWARQVGFIHYAEETIYHLPEVPSLVHTPEIPQMRPRRPADHQALFQLYCTAVPLRVRQAEAMTLHEWRWTDGWWLHPMSLRFLANRARSDYVIQMEERASGWLQVDRRHRRLGVLTDAREAIDVEALVRYGLAKLGPGRGAFCAVRDYQPDLAAALEEIGFRPIQVDALLSRALAKRLPDLKLVPVRAS